MPLMWIERPDHYFYDESTSAHHNLMLLKWYVFFSKVDQVPQHCHKVISEDSATNSRSYNISYNANDWQSIDHGDHSCSLTYEFARQKGKLYNLEFTLTKPFAIQQSDCFFEILLFPGHRSDNSFLQVSSLI